MKPMFSGAYFQPSILKCPNGKFKFVGTLPEEVLVKGKNHIGQKDYFSPLFNSYEEAQNFYFEKTNKQIN